MKNWFGCVRIKWENMHVPYFFPFVGGLADALKKDLDLFAMDKPIAAIASSCSFGGS